MYDKLKEYLRRWANASAKASIARRASLSVAATARVDFRRMKGRPPRHFAIGEGSIFEGIIAADRPGCSVTIGRNTFFGNSTIVSAERVAIGDDVLISWGCTIVDHDSHTLDWHRRKGDVRGVYEGHKDWTHIAIRPVTICDKVWVGFNVIILKGVTIGEGAVVAAGSVVTRDVPPYTLVAGSPARVIRKGLDGLQEQNLVRNRMVEHATDTHPIRVDSI